MVRLKKKERKKEKIHEWEALFDSKLSLGASERVNSCLVWLYVAPEGLTTHPGCTRLSHRLLQKGTSSPHDLESKKAGKEHG